MSYTPNATAGDDILTGDAQPDVIDALEGDDIVFGGGGDDELLGGPGNDRLYGEAGNDRLLGGTGDDRYQVDRTDMVTEQVDEGTDSVYFRDDSFTGIYFLAANVENLTMIGRFNNLSAFGNSLDNRIYGNNTGNDTLLGGAGNDYIQGDFAYLNGSNSFSSDTGEDLLRGGAGDDVIWGDQGEGKELIHSLANDRLYGDNGDDFLYGQAGADVLDGGLGNDALYGGAGNDVLDGGFDLLPPGKEADLFGSDYFPGNDVLAGGAGDDVYLFGRSSRSDRVLETAAAGEANQLRFEDGVIAADVAVRHEGNDLNFYIVGFADNKLSVVVYFSASARPLTTRCSATARYGPPLNLTLRHWGLWETATVSSAAPMAMKRSGVPTETTPSTARTVPTASLVAAAMTTCWVVRAAMSCRGMPVTICSTAAGTVTACWAAPALTHCSGTLATTFWTVAPGLMCWMAAQARTA